MVSSEDQVRDAVNRCAIQCGRAVLVDLLHRLQDRQRQLHHCLRLNLVGRNGRTHHVVYGSQALAFNAATAEITIWDEAC